MAQMYPLLVMEEKKTMKAVKVQLLCVGGGWERVGGFIWSTNELAKVQIYKMVWKSCEVRTSGRAYYSAVADSVLSSASLRSMGFFPI